MIKCYINPPNKVFCQISLVLLISLICHTPIVSWGHSFTLWPFKQSDDEKCKKAQSWYVPFMLLEQIFAQWQHPVASRKAMELLHQAMCAVLYLRTAMAIGMASKVSVFFHCCFVCCCPGAGQGNTEQVVAQWWHPVASSIALDMLH